VRTRCSLAVARSQILMVLSSPPVAAQRRSGLKETAVTADVCPLANTRSGCCAPDASGCSAGLGAGTSTTLACGADGSCCGTSCVWALLDDAGTCCEEERGRREHESDMAVRHRANRSTTCTCLVCLSLMLITRRHPIKEKSCATRKPPALPVQAWDSTKTLPPHKWEAATSSQNQGFSFLSLQ
jgi:hypothetical protein